MTKKIILSIAIMGFLVFFAKIMVHFEISETETEFYAFMIMSWLLLDKVIKI